MKKLQILSALISLLLIGVAVFFAIQWGQDRAMEKRLVTAVATQEEIIVDELTKFKWDKMYVFEAYTSEVQIDKVLGGEFGISGPLYDGMKLVLFVRNGRVVRNATIPVYSGDSYFLKDARMESYTPEDAVFIKSGDEFIKK